SRKMNKYKVEAEKLDDEVFEYIFFEKGDPQELEKNKGIKKEILEELHREFAYWYRLDYRVSANELIPNHLTFMTFHHAALFPEKYRPYSIVSLGLGILEGRRMSSSRGIVFAVSEATKKYGADVTRFYLMYMCEPWIDFNWKGIEAESTKKQIERFWLLANNIIEMNKNKNESKKGLIDNWLISRLQYHIKEVTDALDNFQTRRALQHAFFLLQQDIRWYQRRGGSNAETLVQVLDCMVRMLSPFMPHICEEIWHGLGRNGFVSVAEFPSVDSSKLDKRSEVAEELVESTLRDASEIMKVTKIKPKKIILYVAQRWKGLAYRKAAEFAKNGTLTMSEYMKYAKGESELSKNMKEISKFAPKMIETLNRMSKEELDRFIVEINEYEILKNAKEFFSSELKCDVEVYSADDDKRYDPEGKASKAMPMRPAIYMQE
ncbi:MAG: class I tRNA ligase family protein, partial [Thermoplasmata archaeon]